MDIVTEDERFEVMQVNQERSFLQAEVLYLQDEPVKPSTEEIARAQTLQNEILQLSGSDPGNRSAIEGAQLSLTWSARCPSTLISSKPCWE